MLTLVFAVVLTFGTTLFLRYTNLGTAYRAIANDREITATLGVPVRTRRGVGVARLGGRRGTAGLLLPTSSRRSTTPR